MDSDRRRVTKSVAFHVLEIEFALKKSLVKLDSYGKAQPLPLGRPILQYRSRITL